MSSRHIIAALFAGILFLFQIPALFPQSTQPVLERFRHERSIIPGGQGPNRLLIDSVLLSGGNSQWRFHQEEAGSERRPMVMATGGLGDLRIYDASNREIAYLLIMPPKPEAEWLDGSLSPLAPTEEASGFQIDLGRPLLVDRLRLNGLPAPYVKRCFLEASNNANQWTRLLDDATVFDLPSEELRHLEVEFPRQDYRYFRVVWDDQASARVPLPRSVSARLVSAGSLAPRLQVPLQFERRESEPMKSRYRLRLPGPQLPITEIKLSVEKGNILRQARISEGRLADGEMHPAVLGTAMLRREVRGDLSAGELSINITSPQEAIVELMIEDGNNPPLDITEISAVFAYLPWIYFESPGTDPLIARYGYPKLRAPKYDLEAARLRAARTQTAEALWGEIREIEAEAASFEDSGIPIVGSEIDLALFRYTRRISAGGPGLNVLPLDEAVLAHSRLADLRIAAQDGYQTPYLMERVDEPLSLELQPLEEISIPDSGIQADSLNTGTHSIYRLRLPYQDLPEARVVFTTSSRVFRRNLRILVEESPYKERQELWIHPIAQATWSHSDPEVGTPPLSLQIPSLKATELLVVVEEGDNRPLPITSARLLLPSYQIRFFRESDTELSLYYGHSQLSSPSYDLAILTPRLTGAAAEEVSMGPENAVSVQEEEEPYSLTVFWGILIAAVFVLLAIIVRLIKKTAA